MVNKEFCPELFIYVISFSSNEEVKAKRTYGLHVVSSLNEINLTEKETIYLVTGEDRLGIMRFIAFHFLPGR